MATTRAKSKQIKENRHEKYLRWASDPQVVAKKREADKIHQRQRRSREIQNTQKIEDLTRLLAIYRNRLSEIGDRDNRLIAKIERLEKQNEDLSAERSAALNCAIEYKKKLDEAYARPINDILNNDNAIKDMTGLSRENFNEISNLIREVKNSMTGSLKRRYCSETKYNDREKLYITLFWLRHYQRERVLHWTFKIARSTLIRYLRRTVELIFSVLKDLIKWPSEQEIINDLYHWNPLLPAEWQNLIFVIDGTEIRINRPLDKHIQRSCYSKKHEQTMLNVLLITKLNGEAIYVSRAVPTPSDQRIWNILHLRENFVAQHFGLIADSGFTLNNKRELAPIRALTPIKKPIHEELTAQQKFFNKTVSQLRVVVENRLSQLKNWKILSNTYRHHSFERRNSIPVDLIIQTTFRLSEISIKDRPLRSYYWVPPYLRDALMLDILPSELPQIDVTKF